jgi:hypothetical protein
MVGGTWMVAEHPQKAKRAKTSPNQGGAKLSSPRSRTPRSAKRSTPSGKLHTPRDAMLPPPTGPSGGQRQYDRGTPTHGWKGDGTCGEGGDIYQQDLGGADCDMGYIGGAAEFGTLDVTLEADDGDDDDEEEEDEFDYHTLSRRGAGIGAEGEELDTPVSSWENVWLDVGEDIRQTLSPVGQMEVEAMSEETRQVRPELGASGTPLS